MDVLEEGIFENLSMSVVSMAHRLHAIVDDAPPDALLNLPEGEPEQVDLDRTMMVDSELCDKVKRFIETCTSPSVEAHDEREGVVKPHAGKKTVYHLSPFSDLFNSKIMEWNKNPAMALEANFYVERVPDSDAKCSKEMDALLVKFVAYNLSHPLQRSDWCIIEAPLATSSIFEFLLQHAFFITTLTDREIATKTPANEADRRQTRFEMKDDRAKLSLQDTHIILHDLCKRMGLVIVDQLVYVTRLVNNRAERLTFSMSQFMGDVERACWIDCSDYTTAFRVHRANDSIVNTVTISYHLEHIEDIHPQFSINFKHCIHFPRISFKLDKNVEHQFNPYMRM